MYATKSQMKFTIIKSSLCDYSDANVLAEGTIKLSNTGTAVTPSNVGKS